MALYQLLNYFFFITHTALVLFNMFGWISKKTRKWNLLTLLLTASSWFIAGIWYGWGYCVCTDWHWEVREKLGYQDDSGQYIHFLILKLTGIRFPEERVTIITLIVFLVCISLSLSLNLRDGFRERVRRKRESPL